MARRQSLRLKGVSKKNSRKVRWKSSNRNVVQVNKRGYLFGKKVGRANVFAIYGGRKYRCRVFVRGKAAKSATSVPSTLKPATAASSGAAVSSATPMASASATADASSALSTCTPVAPIAPVITNSPSSTDKATETPGGDDNSDVTEAPKESSEAETARRKQAK